jgi:hypothetical protein
MSKIELPPEPSAAAWRIDASYWTHHDSIPFALLPPVNEPEALFTADQLRARDRQIVEVCIQAAENAEAGDGSHDYNAGAETMQERIVAAIRNLIEESNNG